MSAFEVRTKSGLMPSPPKTKRPSSAHGSQNTGSRSSSFSLSNKNLKNASSRIKVRANSSEDIARAKDRPVISNRASQLRINFLRSQSSGDDWMLKETREYLSGRQQQNGRPTKGEYIVNQRTIFVIS